VGTIVSIGFKGVKGLQCLQRGSLGLKGDQRGSKASRGSKRFKGPEKLKRLTVRGWSMEEAPAGVADLQQVTKKSINSIGSLTGCCRDATPSFLMHCIQYTRGASRHNILCAKRLINSMT